MKVSIKRRLPAAGRLARRSLGATAALLRASFRQVRGGGKLIKRGEVYYVPLWLPIALALALASAALMGDAVNLARKWLGGERELPAFFAPSVRHWAGEIGRWADEQAVDPHLLATVMQIESCGHPTVISPAGAQGLFQVMPFHFEAGEDMLDPATNAARGGAYLNYCGRAAGGVIGLTLACYNGGPSTLSRAPERWSHETRQYHRWGVGIYSDAVAGGAQSETMEQWLAAGGRRLCASAMDALSGG